ncbi:hypothetical protein S245_008016, partial [Arachis hypogaea]
MNNPKSLIPSLTQFPNFTTLMRAFCVSLCSVKFCSTPPCSSAPPCSSRVEFCFAPPCSSARAEFISSCCFLLNGRTLNLFLSLCSSHCGGYFSLHFGFVAARLTSPLGSSLLALPSVHRCSHLKLLIFGLLASNFLVAFCSRQLLGSWLGIDLLCTAVVHHRCWSWLGILSLQYLQIHLKSHLQKYRLGNSQPQLEICSGNNKHEDCREMNNSEGPCSSREESIGTENEMTEIRKWKAGSIGIGSETTLVVSTGATAEAFRVVDAPAKVFFLLMENTEEILPFCTQIFQFQAQ